MSGESLPEPLLLYDGECALCNAAVRFVLDRDPAGKVHFAALQSEIGREMLRRHGLEHLGLTTMVLVDQGEASYSSTGALNLCRYLRRPWSWLSALRVVPRPIRDAAYAWVARNRFRWFGRVEYCRVAREGEPGRFM